MNKPISYIILLIFIFITITLVSRQQHILPTLLILERLILFIIIYIPISLNKQFIAISSLIIILLTIRVSRARVGIAIIVITSRKEGNDCRIRQDAYIC